MLVHYSMLNQTAFIPGGESGERDYGGVAARAAARGMGISNLRVLEAGLLAGNSRERAKPEYGREAERARSLDSLRANGSLTETAIRFALSNPAISTVLIGVSETAHVEQAVAAEARGPLPVGTLVEIEHRRAAGFPLLLQ
jgi:aryl-alcohol dehydrogenase-like predicted oxidoreductase